MFSACSEWTKAALRGGYSLIGNGTCLFVPLMPIYDTSTHTWLCTQRQHIEVYLVNLALFSTWPSHSLPLHLGRWAIWSSTSE